MQILLFYWGEISFWFLSMNIFTWLLDLSVRNSLWISINADIAGFSQRAIPQGFLSMQIFWMPLRFFGESRTWVTKKENCVMLLTITLLHEQSLWPIQQFSYNITFSSLVFICEKYVMGFMYIVIHILSSLSLVNDTSLILWLNAVLLCQLYHPDIWTSTESHLPSVAIEEIVKYSIMKFYEIVWSLFKSHCFPPHPRPPSIDIFGVFEEWGLSYFAVMDCEITTLLVYWIIPAYNFADMAWEWPGHLKFQFWSWAFEHLFCSLVQPLE